MFNGLHVFSIVITEKGGAQRQLDFDGAEIGIGRLEDNDLCLPKNNVSKYHARLIFKDDRYVIVDRKSTNGTYVNGRRISSPMVVRRGDKIYIGDFILTLGNAGANDVIASRTRSPLPPAPDLQRTAATVPLTASAPATFSGELARTALERRAATATARGVAPPAAAEGTPARVSSVPPPLPKRSTPPPEPPASIPPPSAASTSRPGPSNRRGRRAAVATRPSMLPPPAASEVANDAVQAGMTAPTVLAPALRLQGALSMLMERLATHMNVARSEESAFPAEHQATLDRLLDQLETEGVLGPDIDRKFLREAGVSEAVGLGPLDRLLASRAVREIIVDGPARVLADLGSGLAPVSAFFSDDSAVLVVARRLLHRAGQRLEGDAPVYDALLPGGGNVQLLMPPLSPKGPLISVRCPARAHVTPESLVSDAVLSSDMLALLRGAVQQRRCVLVFGPDGAGVSTLLGVLALFASEHERIIAIEDTPGASLHNAQIVPLSRRALPDADLAQLLRRASQLRADRLLIDDLRPPEALTALGNAAGTSGVLFGMHAPSPELALALLEQFAQAGLPAHTRVRGPLMAAAIQVLVHVAPDAGGVRRVRSITEVQLDAAQTIELKTLYRHDGKAFIASFLGD